MRISRAWLSCISMALIFWAKSTAMAQNIDSRVLSIDAFYGLILENHPVAAQAALLSEEARQALRIARGNFDPAIQGWYEKKQFDQKVYWDEWAMGLKVPTWPGIDLKLGYESASGNFIDPSRTFPQNGLTAIGVELPIGRGLFIDERRTMLKQAQLFRNVAEAERIRMINDLLLAAAFDYWDWSFFWQRKELAEYGLNLAQQRLNLVRQNVREGAEAAIDTVEAFIALQARSIELEKAKLNYENSSNKLSTYLWSPEMEPLELEPFIIPSKSDAERGLPQSSINELISLAKQNHPELVSIRLKQEMLTYDLRLARENLKPVLNLSYSYLMPGRGITSEFPNWSWTESYKIGAGVYIPLLFRSERGKLGLSKVKLSENRYYLSDTQQKVLVQLQNEGNYLETNLRLLRTYADMVTNNQTLLRAENLKFFNGESSLFLVNTREVSLLNSLEKQLEMQVEVEKLKLKLLWAAGIPYLNENPSND
jgi:outer membrane protein TolC